MGRGSAEAVEGGGVADVILLLQQGDVVEAQAELARFEQAARELRQPILLVHLQWLHSMWAMLEGRLEDAESLAATLSEAIALLGDEHAR